MERIRGGGTASLLLEHTVRNVLSGQREYALSFRSSKSRPLIDLPNSRMMPSGEIKRLYIPYTVGWLDTVGWLENDPLE